MSITFYVSAIVASLITCALGAYGMRFIFERNREIAESEDPRDSQIRDLQASLTVNQKDATLNKATAADAKEHVNFAHDRINELIAEGHQTIEKLDSVKELLKTKIGEREELHDKATAAEKEVFQLKEQLQEVELELSMASESGNMLDPTMQASDRTQTAIRVSDVERKQFQEQLAATQNKLSEAETEAARLKEQLQQAEEKLSNAANAPSRVPDTDRKEFDEKLAGSEAQLKKTENMLNVTKTQLTTAEEKLTAAQSRLSEDQEKFAAIQSKLSAAKRKLAEDEAQVAAAQKEAANKLSAAEEKLAAAENLAVAAEGKLSSTESKLATAETRIPMLENQLSMATKAADDKVAAATKQTTELRQRLQETEKKATAPSLPAGKPLPDVERKQFQANITALKTKLSTAEKQRSEAEAQRSAAESKASGFESKISAAEYMLSATEKDAQAKLDASEKEVAELKQRLQEVDQQLDASVDTNEMTMPAINRPTDRRQLQTPIQRPDRRQHQAAGDQPDVSESGTDHSDRLLESTVEDGSPSLIQCLTEELDRWKRHAHVLGDELKHQRVQPVADSAAKTESVQSEHAPAPQPGPATAESHAAPVAATTPDQDDGSPDDAADVRDALTDIRGIGKVIAGKLNEIGIYSFERLASIAGEDRERIRAMVPDFENRMKRFDYETQARTLHDRKYNAKSQSTGDGTIFSGLSTT